MRISFIGIAAALGVAAFGAILWWAVWSSTVPPQVEGSTQGTGRILYYRDPSGAPYFSPAPKKNAQGRAYLPVRAIEAAAPSQAKADRKVLYYRNPMGLPDTSPVPKKDNMGMDYIPVYADEAGPPGTVQISLDRVQRLGVRTAPVVRKSLTQTVKLAGTVMADESKQSVVSLKFMGSISEIHVAVTGARVRAGAALFDLHSPFLLRQEAELAIALRAAPAMQDLGGVYAQSNRRAAEVARDRLELYDVPAREIERLI